MASNVFSFSLSERLDACLQTIGNALGARQGGQAASLKSVTRAMHQALTVMAEQPCLDRELARKGLLVAESLREIAEALPNDLALRELYEEFSDEAEVWLLSCDPGVVQSLRDLEDQIRSGKQNDLEDWTSSDS